MNEWVVTFDAPAPLLSMNQKKNMASRRFEQEWRDAAYYAYVAAFPGMGPSGRALPPCIVHTLLPTRSERRRDPANFQATVKRIVDGIQRAGAWPDDTPDWVDQRNPRFYTDDSPHQTVIIRLEPMT
jgi:hypothetical protein